MATTSSIATNKYHQNRELYEALTRKDKDEVMKLCQGLLEGPFHVVDMHNDTVLHVAAFSKQNHLVLDLLKMVPESENYKLTTLKNDEGYTILHEAATTEKLIPAAREILRRAPDSQRVRNELNEAPIFLAARYGKHRMFDFLDKELRKVASDEEIRDFHRRRPYDEATILHLSVAIDDFELAYDIATGYDYLIPEQDGEGMTALQLLACKPSAFCSSSKHGRVKRFIYRRLPSEVTPNKEEAQPRFTIPLWESIKMEKRKYESALRLAKYLIEKDTSWELTKSTANQFGLKIYKFWKAPSHTSESRGEGKESAKASESEIKTAHTPLLLATIRGCEEIVKEILEMYPQAIGYVNDKGRNILHLAIKYRQMHIFEFIEKKDVPMRTLIRKIDNKGNTILHMVGIKEESQVKDLRNPALQLQENLLLFEQVKNICAGDHFVEIVNEEGKTADEVFAETNDKLHSEAKEWLKRTAENCTIVAVLIATVAFAAAYTVPGGSNDKTGYPILLNQPFFIIFTIADVLSITFALTSVVTFLSILTSPYRLIDFQRSLPRTLMLGLTLLITSVSMMMLAFAATIILIVHDKREWTKVALYSVAFVPVSIFVASYLRLYASLWKALEESIPWDIFPKCMKLHPAKSSTSIESPSKYEATRFVGSSSTPLEEPSCSV